MDLDLELLKLELEDFRGHWDYSYARLYKIFARSSQLFITLPDYTLFHAFYTEESRKYHNYQHINYLFELNNTVFSAIPLITAAEQQYVELFIWFHDLIYNVREPKENELKSALIFEACYPRWSFTNSVRDTIISSTHLDKPLIEDAWALHCLDIDLAAMGDSNEAIWEVNNLRIREENAHVPDHTYNCNRKSFFERLLRRGFIYHNPYKLAWFNNAEFFATERIKLEITRLQGDIQEYIAAYNRYLTNR